MSQYITKIRTDSGDKQIDYNALANLPDLITKKYVDDSNTEAKSYAYDLDTKTRGYAENLNDEAKEYADSLDASIREYVATTKTEVLQEVTTNRPSIYYGTNLDEAPIDIPDGTLFILISAQEDGE